MPDKDVFEGAYGRLAATRVSTRSVLPAPGRVATMGDASVLWAASRLLPRLAALAPPRRRRLGRPIDDD